MTIGGKINEFFGGRPERIEAELKFTCDGVECNESDILKPGIFRIFAYAKGKKEQVGMALVGVNARGPKPEFYLQNLDVPENYQGAGISSQILDRLEAIVTRHNGICRLKDEIYSNPRAVGMYERRGWRKDGEHHVFP